MKRKIKRTFVFNFIFSGVRVFFLKFHIILANRCAMCNTKITNETTDVVLGKVFNEQINYFTSWFHV